MEIALKPKHKKILDDQLDSGRYRDMSEVVGEALELLQERSQADDEGVDELRGEVRIGFEQVEAGEYVSIKSDEDAERLVERIHEKGLRRLAVEEHTARK